MTSEQFDLVMYRTLVAMGDPTYSPNHTEWDEEYEKMKDLSFEAFDKLCKSGVLMYNQSNNSLNN